VQVKRRRLCGSLLSNWSGDAGPFCIAVEEAALCCSPLGGLLAGSTYSLWAAHQGDPRYYHLWLVSLPIARPRCTALAGVGLVAELPVVVADPLSGGCGVALRRPVLRLCAIQPAARMPAAPVGAPAAMVVVSPDRIDRTLSALVLCHHRRGDRLAVPVAGRAGQGEQAVRSGRQLPDVGLVISL
jgi:hypothetical protein